MTDNIMAHNLLEIDHKLEFGWVRVCQGLVFCNQFDLPVSHCF